MEIEVPWRTDLWADHTLKMLDAVAEVFEYADIWSGREWAPWSIDDEVGNRIASGSAPDAETAKAVVETLLRDRWNARATHG